MQPENVNDTHISDAMFNERQPIGTLSDLEIFVRYLIAAAKIISDFLIICLFKKIKMLRTWPNSLVMHWVIMDLYYVVFYLIEANNLVPTRIISSAPCIVESVISGSFLTTLIFAVAILIGFVVLNSRYNVLKNHERTFKTYYIPSVYILCLLEYITEFLRCHYQSRFDNLMVVTHTMLLVSIIINIYLKKCVKCDDNNTHAYYILYISNIATFSVLPVLLYHYLLTYCQMYIGFIKFVEATFFIAHLILLSNSIIIVVILYNFYKDFRTIILFVFRKIVRGSEKPWSEIQQEV